MRRRSYALAGLALVALVGNGGCGGGSEEAPSIAFVRATGGPPHYDLATARADGGDLRLLSGGSRKGTVVPTLFAPPAWSPDGRLLAFGGRHGGIYVMPAGGGAQRQVTKLRDAVRPLWSPDGETIVFTREPLADGPPAGSLWSIRADGTALRQLTRRTKGRIDAPGSFSPSGDRLFFTRATCAPPGRGGCLSPDSAVYVAKADGTSQRLVLRHALDPAVSPDGSKIAFASDSDRNGTLNYGDREFFANELYVVNADGSARRRLTRTRELNEVRPAWLPDGTRIAFQRGRQIDNAEGTSLVQVNSDGTCERKILADPRLDTWYTSPAWQPGEGRPGGPLKC